jgi:hypothetical protein
MTLRRFNDDINGTADATGAATLRWRGMTGEFASVLMIARAAGAPSWLVNINGSPVNVGRGVNSPLRLPILEPGEIVTLTVAGALPAAAVSAHIVGYASDAGMSELPVAPPEPSTIALDTSGQLGSVLERFDTSLLQTKTWTLPAGTASVGVGVDLNETTAGSADPAHSVIPASITLTGLPSGANYLLFVPNAGLRQIFWAALNPEDTRLNILTDGVHPNGCFVDILTSPLVIAGQGGDQLGNLSVSLQRSLPAPWQAPNLKPVTVASVIAAGASVNPIAAVAGKIIYLFSFAGTVDAVGAAGSDLRFFDGDPATTGVERGRMGTNVQPPPVNFFGAALTASNGFFLFNGGASSTTVRGIVVASQA